MAFLHPVDIDALNARAQGSLVEHVGIVVTAAGDDWLRGTMPVDARTRQPYGLLHGGASVVLAETLGSMAGGPGNQRQPPACGARGRGDRYGPGYPRGPQHPGVGNPHRE